MQKLERIVDTLQKAEREHRADTHVAMAVAFIFGLAIGVTLTRWWLHG